jgi:hypothetical protein
MLSLFERKSQTPLARDFIKVSKHLNSGNRAEFAESGAPERNEPFGEEEADSAD